ncbi:alpha/beta hydrolase [Marinibacterium sp. SX1]|uniref:alpha/beta hydrolase n=1 Tax=Marinibacterium sp. SX1 TaxID=3388424 RepID=UPI003D16814B
MIPRTCLAPFLCLGLGAGAALAQATTPTVPPEAAQTTTRAAPPAAAPVTAAALLDLNYLAQTDPPAALPALAATLAALQAAPDPDARLVFDLLALQAELTADPAARAALTMQMAALALRSPALDEDPAALFARARGLYETAGDLDGAQVAADERLAVLLDRAYPPQVVAQGFRDFARISETLGDLDLAERARDRAEAVLAPTDTKSGVRGAAGEFHSIDVYYATDRAPEEHPGDAPALTYGAGRGELDLGVARVTVPASHVPGMVESPSIWRLELRPDPSRHVVLQSVTRMEDAAFFDRLSGEFDGETTEAFVFIHGYNVTFDQAARRAAQMAYDMNYPAVPILYSWPSRGSTLAYVADTAVVRLSGRRLAGFLEDLAARSGAETIHIVAHSMGNRALTDALEILALQHGVQAGDDPMFGQVVFAAPDVDAGLFARMARTIRPIARRLTLYASEQDWALVSSRKLHGNAPRAGQGGAVTLVDENIDSIDMSELGEDMLAHSYFADESSALADIVALFWRDAAPDRRCGLEPAPGTGAAGGAWLYREGSCETEGMIDALSHLRRAGIVDPGRIQGILAAVVTDQGLRARLEPALLRLFQP